MNPWDLAAPVKSERPLTSPSSGDIGGLRGEERPRPKLTPSSPTSPPLRGGGGSTGEESQ